MATLLDHQDACFWLLYYAFPGACFWLLYYHWLQYAPRTPTIPSHIYYNNPPSAHDNPPLISYSQGGGVMSAVWDPPLSTTSIFFVSSGSSPHQPSLSLSPQPHEASRSPTSWVATAVVTCGLDRCSASQTLEVDPRLRTHYPVPCLGRGPTSHFQFTHQYRV